MRSGRRDGPQTLHKPLLTLGYVRFRDSGRLVTMTTPPPLDGLDTGQAILEDVNGDALPDVLYGVAGAYRYYENVDGVKWAASPRSMASSPEVGLGEPGVMMVDADGDGFRDVLYPHLNAFRYASGGDIKDGVARGYGAQGPKELTPQGQWGFDWTSPLVKVSDLNFDGRIDLLVQRPGALGQVLNTESGVLAESTLPQLPPDVDFADSRVQMLDFNGDGVLDFVRTDINYQQGSIRVWYGLGLGAYLAEQCDGGVPDGRRRGATPPGRQRRRPDGPVDRLRARGWRTASTTAMGTSARRGVTTAGCRRRTRRGSCSSQT